MIQCSAGSAIVICLWPMLTSWSLWDSESSTWLVEIAELIDVLIGKARRAGEWVVRGEIYPTFMMMPDPSPSVIGASMAS